MNHLPIPEKPYETWPEFINALWAHGRGHCTPENAAMHADRAAAAMKESLLPVLPNKVNKVRPSSFLCCARATDYLLNRGEVPAAMPRELGFTFAMGHVMHEVSYAYCKSALPPGFVLADEVKTNLPDWWPDDERFNQSGTMDMVIRVDDADLVEKYLAPEAGNSCLTDFKTQAEFAWREHKRSNPGKKPDGFGNVAQTTVYSNGGQKFDCTILAGINRSILMADLASRAVPPFVLAAESVRLQEMFKQVLAPDALQPGFDFLERNGEDGLFYCGNGLKKKGYCPFKVVCLKDRRQEPYEV